MPFPRAGFGLVSLKTGFASDVTNILAIGGIQLNRETVNRIFYILRIHFILFMFSIGSKNYIHFFEFRDNLKIWMLLINLMELIGTLSIQLTNFLKCRNLKGSLSYLFPMVSFQIAGTLQIFFV